ncbi:treacle protein [Trichomycterus rosablanca]|uniref:treacle protein n=1 Tax=Trichomycterus rosablanca TaxID=2290929 RepID=UPI002F35A6A1
MASSFRRRIGCTEKRAVCQETESWLAVLLQCVGIKKLLDLINGTGLVSDLQLFKDLKPARPSGWAFDDGCFFCRARRDKVKEHVAALNKKIVDSGGKPLLGRDHSNVARLEGQIEDFLDSVVHRTEYKPRIPDPHIPLVARDVLQLIIRHFLMRLAAPASASDQNPVLSKLLMPDQDAPLDLSVRKVKSETREQDRVLDLSVKKNRNQEPEPLRRDSLEPDSANDLHPVATLEDLMAKLCSHHQRQIVDAFTFLETEIKAASSSGKVQDALTSGREPKTERKGPGPAAAPSVAINESKVSKIEPVSVAETSSESEGPSLASVGTEPEPEPFTAPGEEPAEPKCPTLRIVKNRNSGNLEAKKVPEVNPDTVTLEQGTHTSDTHLHTSSVEHATVEPSSTSTGHGALDPKSCRNIDSTDAVKRLPDETSPNSTKTARKSIKGSRCRPRDPPPCRALNDPDVIYDIVYVAKPITECELESQRRMNPRRNARKSTRGHRYVGDYLEVKTVRTLSRGSVGGSGNCPVRMPEITTSVTPKQALAKPDGVPGVDALHAGDCMETVGPLDQAADTETPGDVVAITDEEMIVEPSQTGQCEASAQQDLTEIHTASTPENVELATLNTETRGSPGAQGENIVISRSSNCDSKPEPQKQTERLKVQVPELTVGRLPHSRVPCGSETNTSSGPCTELTQGSVLASGSSDEGRGGASDGGEQGQTELDDLQSESPSHSKPSPTSSESNSVHKNSPSPEDDRISGATEDPELGKARLPSPVPQVDAVEEEVPSRLEVLDFAPADDELQGRSRSPLQKSPKASEIKSVRDRSTSERMLLRNRGTTSADQPVEGEPCSSTTEDVIESLEGTLEPTVGQPNDGDSCSSPAACPVERPERMPLRSRNANTVKQPSVSDSGSPINATPVKMQERLPLRSGSSAAVEQPSVAQPCSPLTSSPLERPERMPLRSRNSTALDQSSFGDSATPQRPERMPLRSRNSAAADHPSAVGASLPERPQRMPLRSRNSAAVDQSSVEGSPERPERMPLRSRSTTSADHPSVEQSCSSPSDRPEQMPMKSRSSTAADQSSIGGSCSSLTASSPERPERMPLRSRSTTNADQASVGQFCSSPSASPAKSSEQMPTRSTAVVGGSCSSLAASSPERPEQMSLRSRSTTPADRPSVEQSCSSPSERPEQMQMKSRSSTAVDPSSVGDSCNSIPASPAEKPERMPLRSRSNIIADQTSSGDVSGSSTASPVEKSEPTPVKSRNSSTVDQPTSPVERQERMTLRGRISTAADQSNVGGSCSSSVASTVEIPESKDQPVDESPNPDPSKRPGRTPLRTRHDHCAEQTTSKDSPHTKPLEVVAHMPLRSSGHRVIEESSVGIKDADDARSKLEIAKHMPLRSESESPVRSGPESPGRMSLRSKNSSEKLACLPTPPKCKKLPQRIQRTPKKSLLHLFQESEQIPEGSNSNVRSEARSFKQHPFTLFNLPLSKPETASPCKFLKALNGEANQRLILDLNSKFEKMQKGWVQMDKEGQPAPKPKNKADRLKEIWKSKRRVKKPRTLEQHRISPVQMLFMKSFDLPSICQWFLQATETKSLVIVKKVNTRLPSETHLGFPTYASESSGVFPSLQAERLKKHLKKFAIASPVRSNPKNKRLIAKVLAKGAAKLKDKQEKRPAARISSKPQSSRCAAQAAPHDGHGKVNPASARILRKYSNMREKRQVQRVALKKKQTPRSNKKSDLVKKTKPSGKKPKETKDVSRESGEPKTSRKRKSPESSAQSPARKRDKTRAPDVDAKPPSSEDQVQTRSRRKLGARVPRAPKNRGFISKRLRTSK